MIEKLHIKNFQSHKHSELSFVPGVNVIIGDTDSGKSAIIRALRLVVFNKPNGDDYRSNWGGDTEVEIQNEQYIIKRVKTNSKNSYILNDSVFNALRGDVPKEIKEALNVDDINLQQQLDTPYLLTSTPGEVAKHFNKIAKLDKIDKGLTNIKSWITKLSSSITFTETELEKQKTKLAQYGYLEQLEIETEALEQLEDIVSIKQGNSKGLKKLISNIETINKNLANYSALLELENPINEILTLMDEKSNKRQVIKKLQNTISAVNEIDEKLEEINILVSIEPETNKTLTLFAQAKEKQTEIKKLQTLVKTIADNEKDIEQAKTRYEKYHKEFEANMPDICPFCNK